MATSLTVIRTPEGLLERYTCLAQRTRGSRSCCINEALLESIDRLEYEYRILKNVEGYEVGRLKTYTLEEIEEMLGLDD